MTYFECIKEMWDDFTLLGKIVLFLPLFIVLNMFLFWLAIFSPIFFLGIKFDRQLTIAGEKIKRLFIKED